MASGDVVLQRDSESDDGTPGTLVVKATNWNCNTLELPWRDNIQGRSRIPAGTYPARLMWSLHFLRDLYHLLDVPEREAVEMHNGTWAGALDAGKHSDVKGCILQGFGYSRMDPWPLQLGIMNSRITVDSFIKHMQGKPFDLEIRDVQNALAG